MIFALLSFAEFTYSVSELKMIKDASQVRKFGRFELRTSQVCSHTNSNNVVEAVKILCATKFSSQLKSGIASEIKMMTQFDHPNVIKGEDGGSKQFKRQVDGKSYTLDCFQIIMPFYDTDLSNYLIDLRKMKSEANSHKSEFIDKMKNVMRQILSGLDFIHSKGYAHLDIKPENILEKEGHYVLADLEHMRESNSEADFINVPMGTYVYMPPQMINEYGQWTNDFYDPKKADMFQLGAMLGVAVLEIFTNVKFYDDKDGYRKGLKVFPSDTTLFEAYLSEFEPQMIDFIKKLTHTDPNLRLTAREALTHEWIILNKNFN
eukprot:NODE_127_length_17034_cov_0.369590.p3 type:complete len:319 gc:universal NODE_127_length_17034_cov_0.369590:2523-1567(-)